MKIKIHSQLLLIYSAVTLLIFLISGGFWVYGNYQTQKNFFEQRIQSGGVLVANNIGAAILFKDKRSSLEILSALQGEPSIILVDVIAQDKTLIHSLQFLGDSSPPIRQGNQIFWGDVELQQFITPVEVSGEKLADLIIYYHEGELRQSLFDSLRFLLVVMCIAFGIGILLISVFQRSITTPVAKLARVARQVTETGDYSYRSSVQSNNEISDLASALNSMLDIIESREKTLEGLIFERTQSLINKNNELKVEIDERNKSELARLEIEALFEQVFNKAPSGMVLIDESRKIMRANAVIDHLSVTEQQVGVSLDEIIVDELGDIAAHIDKLVSGEISQFEVEAQCYPDNDSFVIVSGAAVRDSLGSFRYGILNFQDITEIRRLTNRLDYQAHHDILTGLPNRRMLNRTLGELKQSEELESQHHALCVIDLDLFKTVNDTCGHVAGDELLRQIAELIRETVRREDQVVRLGGDEFAVLLYNCQRSEVESVADSIRHTVADHVFNWEGEDFRVTASIGAIFVPQDFDIQLTLQQADAACYVAKELGRNRVHTIELNSPDIVSRQSEINWLQRLQQSIKQDDFVLYGQAMLGLGETTGHDYMEILLRLRDPDDDTKVIPPDVFLPAAERYGLMAEIDEWVINRVLLELPQYREIYGDKRAYWINLSAASIGNKSFVDMLESRLRATDFPVGMINFEITETSTVKNLAEAKTAMLRLKVLGCQFALDDFGSGMTSFAYLDSLPVDYIKIDGMFVSNVLEGEVNGIFVETIVKIAAALGIKTIAEYVENQELLHRVTALGVDYAQGFGISKPAPMIAHSDRRRVDIEA